MATVLLRLATPADAEQIRAIYNHEVMHTTATFDLVPRSLADQQEWLATRSGAFATLVAADPDDPVGEIVGFGALSPYKERAAYRTSASGAASIALHQRCGFELVGIEREVGRKFNRWHDVALMERLL